MPFFRLPTEIRNIIYSLVLFVGHVHPYNDSGARVTDGPCVALLQTCKRLRDEAKPFLHRNIFRFTTTESLEAFLRPFLRVDQEHRVPVERIELVFKWTGFEPERSKEIVEESIERKIEDGARGVAEPNCLARHHHQIEKEFLRRSVWKRLVDVVVNSTAPHELILDFRRCVCRDGCCRLQVSAIRCFRAGFASGKAPPIVKLRGFYGFYESSNISVAESLVSTMLRCWSLSKCRDIEQVCSTCTNELDFDWDSELQWDVFLEDLAPGYQGPPEVRSRKDLVELFHAWQRAEHSLPVSRDIRNLRVESQRVNGDMWGALDADTFAWSSTVPYVADVPGQPL